MSQKPWKKRILCALPDPSHSTSPAKTETQKQWVAGSEALAEIVEGVAGWVVEVAGFAGTAAEVAEVVGAVGSAAVAWLGDTAH